MNAPLRNSVIDFVNYCKQLNYVATDANRREK